MQNSTSKQRFSERKPHTLRQQKRDVKREPAKRRGPHTSQKSLWAPSCTRKAFFSLLQSLSLHAHRANHRQGNVNTWTFTEAPGHGFLRFVCLRGGQNRRHADARLDLPAAAREKLQRMRAPGGLASPFPTGSKRRWGLERMTKRKTRPNRAPAMRARICALPTRPRQVVWKPRPGLRLKKVQSKWLSWAVGLMDKASASGAGDSRFKSWAAHVAPGGGEQVSPPLAGTQPVPSKAG